MRAPLTLLVLLTPLLPLVAASAQPSAPQDCAIAPASKVVVNVKDKGAKGDGRTDETAAIQKAIDEVARTGGSVLVPDGVYMINAVAPGQLALKSGVILKLAPGAILRAIANGSEGYAILTITGASHVGVIGGILEGDRKQHLGKTGEWGMGIRVDGGSEHVTISDVTSKDMWGDGFYIDGAKDVRLCNIVADYNRRQGLSIIDAVGVLVTNSVFKNTRGTRPSAGIDLEPDLATQVIRDVRITRSKFFDNDGGGILIQAKKGAQNITAVEITRNLFKDSPPVKIKYAKGVLNSAICQNRYAVRQERAPGDLVSMARADREVIVLAGCGDPGLRKRQ